MNIFRKNDPVSSQTDPNIQHCNGAGSRAAEDGVLTVISAGIVVKGDISGRGAMRVDGAVEGTVQVEGDITVSAGATVTGDITAQSVAISGVVRGNIGARKLEISETGKIWGDLRVARLLQREGGYHNGRSEMQDENELRMSAISGESSAGE
jgi:cytoskeletal protein CcmA (bactofilin family)